MLFSLPGLWVNSPWNALGYTHPFLITHTLLGSLLIFQTSV